MLGGAVKPFAKWCQLQSRPYTSPTVDFCNSICCHLPVGCHSTLVTAACSSPATYANRIACAFHLSNFDCLQVARSWQLAAGSKQQATGNQIASIKL